jgi:RimJ/RimL family protein N-acetyltransferase
VPKLEKLILREVLDEDLPLLYDIQREPEGCAMAAVTPKSRSEFSQYYREKTLDGDVTIRTIEIDGEVAGDIESFILKGHRTIGYWLGKKYWGRGIATAAVAEFVTSHEKHRPLSAFVPLPNVVSYRVLEKCGFHQVGVASCASDGIEELEMVLKG